MSDEVELFFGSCQIGFRLLQTEAVLRPADKFNLKQLQRTFTLRTSDGFLENFGPGFLSRVSAEAPGVRLRFLSKPDKETMSLRDGTVDLETGVVDRTSGPEIHTEALFRDSFVGVVRLGHPLSKGTMTPARYASGQHIFVSRRGTDKGQMDEALKLSGLERDITAIVSGFSAALALARGTDLIASVPERHTGNLRTGMYTFPLPIPVPEITVSMLWHPRLHSDPAHRWLRGCLRDICQGKRSHASK